VSRANDVLAIRTRFQELFVGPNAAISSRVISEAEPLLYGHEETAREKEVSSARTSQGQLVAVWRPVCTELIRKALGSGDERGTQRTEKPPA
jgi:hypothetical protein